MSAESFSTRPAGGAQQQRRSLRPQGHCVISDVTQRESCPLHLPVLRVRAEEAQQISRGSVFLLVESF